MLASVLRDSTDVCVVLRSTMLLPQIATSANTKLQSPINQTAQRCSRDANLTLFSALQKVIAM